MRKAKALIPLSSALVFLFLFVSFQFTQDSPQTEIQRINLEIKKKAREKVEKIRAEKEYILMCQNALICPYCGEDANSSYKGGTQWTPGYTEYKCTACHKEF